MYDFDLFYVQLSYFNHTQKICAKITHLAYKLYVFFQFNVKNHAALTLSLQVHIKESQLLANYKECL